MHDAPRSTFFFGPFELDLIEQRLLRDGEAVALTPKTFELLTALVTNRGRLMLKDDLLRQVWPDTHVDAANLSRTISVLRATLGEDEGVRYIETVPKRGYRFVAPVGRASTASAPVSAAAAAAPPSSSRASVAIRVAAVLSCVLALAAMSYILALQVNRPIQAVPGRTPVHRQLTATGRESAPAIAPSGTHVAYVSLASPENLLIVQDLSSGQSVIAFKSPEIDNVRWSPDGERLLLFARDATSSGIYVVPRSGGAARKVADHLFKACFSPNAARVAVGIYQRGAILLVDDRGGRQVLTLAGDHRWISDIDWSAASDRILLVTDNAAGHQRIWSIKPDGSDQRLVYEDRLELRGARWAPDGRAVYFSRRDGQTTTFFKVADQRQPAPATAIPLLSGLESNGRFSLSADGSRLAYARAPYHSNLWAVHRRAGQHGSDHQIEQLTSGTTLVERPRISPDGRSVVFNRGYDGRANLFVVPVSGGPVRQLTSLDGLSVGAMWSPDGRQLAFASTDGGRTRSWVADLETGAARPISDAAVSDTYAVTWTSPAQILYQRPDNRDFLKVDVATGRQDGELLGAAATGWVFFPELAPDGRRVAVAWNQRGEHGLWLIDVASGTRSLLLQDDVTPIGWAADGKSVFALAANPGEHRGGPAILGETTRETRVVSVPIDGRPMRELLRLPFEEVGGVSISADGRTIVCAVYSSRSDVWIVEGFDAPAVGTARAAADASTQSRR